MKDSLTSTNAADFSQRYTGTYGWLHLDNKRDFVYVSDVNRRACYFNKGTDVAYHANADVGVIFEFIPVDRGWFNAVDGNVYFLQRRPARQFKRGIADTNTLIYNEKLSNVGISYKILSTIFVDGFDNWQFKDFSKPQALSKHFAITDKDGTLMLYDTKIGQYKTNIITLDSSLFAQELQDTLRRKNIDVRVIVNE
jgi:hypothetical protein